VIGHRGARAVAPENTLEALAAAIEAGAQVVEFDVGPDLLLGHSVRERPAEPVPLEEALSFLGGHEIGIELDLKVTGIEAGIAAAVRRSGLVERAFVASTWARSLRRLAAEIPELRRAISYPLDRYGAGGLGWPRIVTSTGTTTLRAVMPARVPSLLRRASASVLSLHHALVSPAVVRAAHERGAPLLAWTVNDPRDVERVVAAGVDAIVSDDPAAVFRLLATLNPP
jgi:glycerophosphoryl diester phosphodiesterase